MTKFPAADLVASGGKIYCHPFENALTGVPRNMYWSITLDFHPIRYAEEEWLCSMTCEWLTWPLRDWRDLSGRCLELTYGENRSESSFYTWQHDIGKATRLHIGARHDDHFDVRMDMIVDFAGFFATDGNPAMHVHGQATIPYAGVIVVPGNLSPKVQTPAEVRSLVSGYHDTSLYGPPEQQSHAFLMKPLQGI